ncbi:hypothetical protein [Tenacibaculum sp. 190524A02b]|uniref:XRE family transcriptional regulator n=1 Tax=Tenacibaculum vairaonense TaxID=3137860 RepID=A0ABP1FA88_9FLAO
MIIHRIKEFIVFKNISVTDFEISIGDFNGVISHSIDNNIEIHSELLLKITKTYSDLNISWLITGNGTMLKDANIDDLESISIESILDYILANADKFRDEPKIEAIVSLFSNFEQQKKLQSMYEKIDKYEKLIDNKLK